jgi:hypothetical protein
MFSKVSNGVIIMQSVFEALKEDHRIHKAFLRKIEQTIGDSPERSKLFDDFCTEVKSHASAEEQSLYAVMLSKPDLTEKDRHSTSEYARYVSQQRKNFEKLIVN